MGASHPVGTSKMTRDINTHTGDMASKNFESLAPEILLMIVNQLPDLVTLDSLIKASPYAFRVFDDDHAVKIVESVLDAGFTHYHIRGIIGVISRIRSSELQIADLDAFRYLLAVDVLGNPDPTDLPRVCPINLPRSTTSATLRSILASARRIESITLDCLDYYLLRFNQLAPRHLTDATFHWHGVQPWELVYDTRACPTYDIGPPSWAEEQRVSRACWRLQVICDLKKAAAASLPQHWPGEVVEQIEQGSPFWLLYDGWLLSSEMEEHYTPLPFEEINSVTDYIKAVHGDDVLRQLGETRTSRDVRRDRTAPAPAEHACAELEEAAAGYKFYCNAERREHGLSPLKTMRFEVFRPFGFAIWDAERMRAYGLVGPFEALEPPLVDTFQNFPSFAWRSILCAEEIAQQETRLAATYSGVAWIEVRYHNNHEDEIL